MENQKKKIGYLTFGITMILTGIFYILDRFTSLHFFNAYILWPLFLIILGLEFLITKFIYDRKNENIQIVPGIIPIVLVIVILGVTALYRHAPTPKDISDFFSIKDYYKFKVYESYDSGKLPAKNVQSLTIDNVMGKVNIQPSSDSNISVKAQISVRSIDKEHAKMYARNAIKINQGSHALIETKRMYDESHILGSIVIDYTITVPYYVNVVVNSSSGEVKVSNMGANVTVQNKNSDVSINKIAGDVNVDNSYGNVTINQVNGKVQTINKNGKIQISIAGENVTASTSFGDIIVNHVTQNLSADTKNGEILANDIEGNAQLNTVFGDISCSNIPGNATATDKNGDIRITNVKKNISAETSMGSIYMTTSSLNNTQINLKSDSGTIDCKSFKLPLESTSASIKSSYTFGNPNRKIDIKTSNGSIIINKS